MYCSDTPIFIWYDNYPTHCSTDFLDPATNHCRIAKVEPGNKKGLGAASLNLTNIQVNRALSSAFGALALCATHLLRSINAINGHQGHLAVKWCFAREVGHHLTIYYFTLFYGQKLTIKAILLHCLFKMHAEQRRQ